MLSTLKSARPLFTGAAALGVAVLTSVGAAPALAQDFTPPSGTYEMDLTHAMVTWKVSHLGMSQYTARFNEFDIDLTLDSENPANTQINATVNPLSVDTPFPGPKDFNGEVASDARFLNAPEHPEIIFTSTSIEVTGPDTAVMTGDLTMLGVTNSETFDVTLNGALAEHPFGKKPAVGFTAVGVIDRTEYGMSFLAPQVVGADVTIEITAEFLKAD